MRSAANGAALLVLTLRATSVAACSCDDDLSPHDQQVANAFSRADFVAVVEIASTAIITVAREETWSKLNRETGQYHDTTEIVEEQQLVAQVNVLRLWKGPQTIVAIATSAAWQACGLGFQTGQVLLVYGHGPDENGRMQTGSCSRTNLAKDAANDIAVLDALIAFEPRDINFEVQR